jgi:hypothetical protein
LQYRQRRFDVLVRNEQPHTGCSTFQVQPYTDDDRGNACGIQCDLCQIGVDSSRVGLDGLNDDYFQVYKAGIGTPVACTQVTGMRSGAALPIKCLPLGICSENIVIFGDDRMARVPAFVPC